MCTNNNIINTETKKELEKEFETHKTIVLSDNLVRIQNIATEISNYIKEKEKSIK